MYLCQNLACPWVKTFKTAWITFNIEKNESFKEGLLSKTKDRQCNYAVIALFETMPSKEKLIPSNLSITQLRLGKHQKIKVKDNQKQNDTTKCYHISTSWKWFYEWNTINIDRSKCEIKYSNINENGYVQIKPFIFSLFAPSGAFPGNIQDNSYAWEINRSRIRDGNYGSSEWPLFTSDTANNNTATIRQ